MLFRQHAPRRPSFETGIDLGRGLAPPPSVGPGVLVLGMHRSGTSAMTRVVNLLGVPLGSDERVSAHWEHHGLTNFQEGLLKTLGGSWDAPPALSAGWERTPRLLPSVGRARRLFVEHYGGLSSWVWKDPRTSLTLPFWQRALRARMLAIVIHRHPLEVAQSLAVRDDLPKPRALALWERYNRSLLANAAGLRTLVVSYDALVADPVGVARSARTFLVGHGVHCPRPNEQEIRSFVDSGLRHSNYRDDELQTDPGVTPGHRELVRTLRALQGPHAALRHVA